MDSLSSPCDAHIFRSLEEFKVLDFPAFTNKGFNLLDWKKGEKKVLWVSKGMLSIFKGTTYDYWMQFDMNSGQSQAMDELQEEVYQKVQVSGGTVSKARTTHIDGVPRTLVTTHWQVMVHLAGWPEARKLIFSRVESVTGFSEGQGLPSATENSKANHECLVLASELLQHSETITLMFDAASTKLEYANQTAARFYQSVQQDVKSLQDVLSLVMWENAEQEAQIVAAVERLRVDSERIKVECRLKTTGGAGAGDVWHQIHFIPARSPVTSELVVIVTQTDISELQRQRLQVLVASKQQEAFLSAVSHELRTPLNGIIGLSETLEHNPQCTDKMRKSLHLIKTSGLRLSGLVNDILDAASAKRGSFVIKREAVLLTDIVDNVCDVLHAICPRSVAIRQEVQGRIPPIEGDSNRLNQVLTNLVSNAIKFTEQGQIVVSIRMLSDAEVVVEVRDSGCGIPPDKLSQVWAPFKQVDMTTTRKYGGTGLGLSLVKELVEAHHGRVGVASSPLRGSNFFFVLPVQQPAADASPRHSALLILDDLQPGVLPHAPSVPTAAPLNGGRDRSASVDKSPRTQQPPSPQQHHPQDGSPSAGTQESICPTRHAKHVASRSMSPECASSLSRSTQDTSAAAGRDEGNARGETRNGRRQHRTSSSAGSEAGVSSVECLECAAKAQTIRKLTAQVHQVSEIAARLSKRGLAKEEVGQHTAITAGPEEEGRQSRVAAEHSSRPQAMRQQTAGGEETQTQAPSQALDFECRVRDDTAAMRESFVRCESLPGDRKLAPANARRQQVGAHPRVPHGEGKRHPRPLFSRSRSDEAPTGVSRRNAQAARAEDGIWGVPGKT